MKSKAINIVVLVLVFIASLVVAYFIFSIEDKDLTNKSTSGDYRKKINDQDRININEKVEMVSSVEGTESDDDISSVANRIEKIADGDSPSNCIWKVITWFGKPCSNAKITAVEIDRSLIKQWLDSWERGEEIDFTSHETVTSIDGTFFISELENKTYCIRIDVENYGSRSALLDLSGKWKRKIEIEVKREKIIHGIVAGGNGRAIPGIKLMCIKATMVDVSEMPIEEIVEMILFTPETTTAVDGTFSFGGLTVSNYDLYSEPVGYIPVCKSVDVYDQSFQRIILKKPCVLKGRIADESGNPVEGAKVMYRFPQGGLLLSDPKVTDEEGLYQFNDAPEGGMNLQAVHAEHGNVAKRIFVKRGLDNEQDLVLSDGVRIELIVKDGEGNALENAYAIVEDWTTGAFLGRWFTDQNGLVEIEGINRDAKVRLRVKKSGYYSRYSGIHIFQENGVLEIVLKKRVLTHLKVFDDQSKEVISKYHVCICAYPTSTGAREKFSLQRGITEIEYEKEIYEIYVGEGETFGFDFIAEGYLPKHIIVTPADTEQSEEIRIIDVPLERAGVLSGTVVDAISGSPVHDAKLQLYGQGSQNRKPIRPLSKARMTRTAKNGSFSVNGLSKGRFFLKIMAPGYAVTVLDSCELDSSSSYSGNVVRLWPGGVLNGTVLDQFGNPLEEATVQVIPPGTEDVIVTKTNPDGSYSITGIPAGRLEVLVEDFISRASLGAWMKLRKIVYMVPGGSQTANFSFSGSCIVQGTCSYDGKPGWGVEINLNDKTGKTIISAHSSESGYYKLFGISPGEYALETRSTLSGIGGYRSIPLALDESETLTLNIDLEKKAIYGRVVDKNGESIHGAVVELLSGTFVRSHTTTTDQRGSYNILSVEEGIYYLSALADNCAEIIKGPWPVGGTHPIRNVDFCLKSGGIASVVVSNEVRSPVQGAVVQIYQDISKGALRWDETGTSGICVFDSLGLESFKVLVGAEGYSPSGGQVSVSAGEKVTCKIQMIQGGGIRLKARLIDGTPASHAHVGIQRYSLFGQDTRSLARLGFLTCSDLEFLADESGEFTLDRLPAQTFTVNVSKGQLSGSTVVSVSKGRMSTAKVVLQ